MKLTYYVLAAVMIFNSITVLLGALGLTGVPLQAMDVDQWEHAINASAIVEAWDWSDREFYDVGAGLGYIWNLNVPLIEAFQAQLQILGIEPILLDTIKLVWRFFWVGFTISVLSGRDFMP